MDFDFDEDLAATGGEPEAMDVDGEEGAMEQEEGGEEDDFDMDDIPVTQEDSWAVIRYVICRYSRVVQYHSLVD